MKAKKLLKFYDIILPVIALIFYIGMGFAIFTLNIPLAIMMFIYLFFLIFVYILYLVVEVKWGEKKY